MLEEVDFSPSRFGFDEREGRSFELSDAEATRRMAADLAEELGPGDFVGLVGQLGAGKTTWVGGLVEGLGGGERVTSPTYTLVNVYETDPPVYHVDLYRLESTDDLASTGYWDYLESGRGIVCVEWLDRVPAAWPGEGRIIELAYAEEGRRGTIWYRNGSEKSAEETR